MEARTGKDTEKIQYKKVMKKGPGKTYFNQDRLCFKYTHSMETIYLSLMHTGS